jgi:Kef-type K+ transport system membrane component KefB
MPDVEFVNLLAISVVALLAPLILGLAPGLRVPSVVLEIIAGVVLGPQVLGWVEVDLPVGIVALLGLAFLLFLARLALAGYVVTLMVGVTVGFGLTAAGWASGPGLVAVTLSATSLGLVVPVLKDAGRVESRLGQTTVAAASIADFAAIVLLSLLFSTAGSSTGTRLVLLGLFAVLVAATAAAVSLVSSSPRLEMTLTGLQDTTAEIRVRGAVVLLVAFVALAEAFGLESILGAFLAGAVVGIVDKNTASHPHFRLKLEAIGYGFLIPVFFVSSGLRLDLGGLVENPGALVRVPVFLLALLLVRGLPALLFSRLFDRRSVLAAGLLKRPRCRSS